MSHYAQLDENNVVVFVIHAKSNDKEDEFTESTGDVYRQTYLDGSTRFNYAGIGFTYDEARDAFIPPTPYPSWVLDEATCLWVAPIDYPADGKMYTWDELTTSWIEYEQSS